MNHPYALELAKQRIQEMIEAAQHSSVILDEHVKDPKAIWEVPGYKKLFSSYCISVIGQWFDMVALMVLFGYIWHTEPYMLALIPVAYGAPQALLSQFAGVFVERVNKLRLMAIAHCLTVILTLGLFTAASPWTAIAILALRASVNVVHYPAQQSLIRSMIPEALRIQAITWNGGITQAAKIIAPLAGGALIAFISAKSLLLINAAAFALSACLLFSLQKQIKFGKQKMADPENHRLAFIEQWQAGWKIVIMNNLLLLTISLTLFGMIVIQLVDAQFPALFREIAAEHPEYMTWIISSVGAGSISAMYLLNRRKNFQKIGLFICTGLAFIGIGFAGIGLLQTGFSVILALLLGFVCGIGTGILLVISNYVIQTAPLAKDVSIVAGIFQTLMSTSVFISPLIGALLIQITSVRTAFIACGIALILFAFPPLFLKKMKNNSSLIKKQKVSV